MSLSENDIKSAHHNSISKIKSFIRDNWDSAHNRFEAYAYLFDNILPDLRRDFLTDVTYYRNGDGKQVPVENSMDIMRSLATTCGLKPEKVQMHLAVHCKLLKPRWLIDIPEWDKVDRLKTLCFSVGVSNLSQECFYQHLVAWGAGIFARANDKYAQNHVLIMRGDQGIGKDFFIKILLKGLGPYYGLWTNSRDEKDILMLMERSLVLNIPEFDNTHQNEVALLKSLITKYQALYRAPYARKPESVDLHTSFISSANCEYLLRDGSGNRRYLIFVLESFGLIDKFDGFDSLQILAQFKNAYEVGFKVDAHHKAASDAYIATQTPPPIEGQIFEFWNSEIKDYVKLTNGRHGEWIPAHSVNFIFAKIKKEFGFGRNHVAIILQNRGCRARRAAGTYYCANVPLHVAPDPQSQN